MDVAEEVQLLERGALSKGLDDQVCDAALAF